MKKLSKFKKAHMKYMTVLAGLVAPSLCFADDSGGLTDWLNSFTDTFKSIISFGFTVVMIVGILVACFGMYHIVAQTAFNKKYEKVSMGRAIACLVVGLIFASPGVIYKMVATTTGSNNAVAQATAGKFNGLDN